MKTQLQRIKKVLLTAVTTAGLGLVVAAPSFAQTAPAPDYKTITNTASEAVTIVGGLALVAFGSAIAPFIGRIAMLSISQVFRSM